MLLIFDHGPVREVRLNRPPANALTLELMVALRQAIETAPQAGCRAMVLSGLPGRFSGGLDVPVLLGYDRTTIGKLWREFYALLRALAASPIPIATAITGHAPAGGTVLGLFCDFRIMAEGDFKIGLNEVQVGLVLPPVILAALRRLVGPREAERLAVTGLLLSPQPALTVGLIDALAPIDKVIESAIHWCEALLALPAEAMSATRHDARKDLVACFGPNLDAELQGVAESWWSPETQRALRALTEKLGKKTASR